MPECHCQGHSPLDPEIAAQVAALRRDIHQHPEPAWEETRTSGIVAEHLKRYGLRVERTGATAVMGVLANGNGPTIALRADMDALPLTETATVEYRSVREGVMHACGHDAHTAMLLTAARVLAEQRGDISGEIRFLFQPAEESPPGGALTLIDAGWLSNVNRVCGIHVWNSLATGRVQVGEGPMTAASDRFTITIQGRGGHGAQPQLCVDSVVVGSALVTALQTIISRSVDPLQPAVVTIGTFNAGSNFNVIADTATLTGTVRTFDQQVRLRVRNALSEITSRVCSAYGAHGEVDYREGYPTTVCDPAVAEIVRNSLRVILGPDALEAPCPTMGGEDFAYYTQLVPGVLVFLGSGGESPELAPAHHHPRFDIDERVLSLGVSCWCGIARDLLSV